MSQWSRSLNLTRLLTCSLNSRPLRAINAFNVSLRHSVAIGQGPKGFSTQLIRFDKVSSEKDEQGIKDENEKAEQILEEEPGNEKAGDEKFLHSDDEKKRDPKDRTRVIPVELSIKYMESAAYKETYGDYKVWELYRRNFSKGRSFKDTRKKCIRHGFIPSNSPCPICRDEYLVVDYRNLKLLNQFITDYNGQVLTSKKTGVCQEQWMKIRVELEKAKDRGYLNIDPPFVEYDYEKYSDKESAK